MWWKRLSVAKRKENAFGLGQTPEITGRLTRDIKWKIAEDLGIGYDSRHDAFKSPDQLTQALLQNMGKQDRNRAVMDLLLAMESEERTERIINTNVQLMMWTGLMALATVALAAVEVFKK